MYDVQEANARIDEWHRQADQIRLLHEAQQERAPQTAPNPIVSILISSALKGIGSRFIRAGNWLDARYNCRPMMTCEEG